MERGLGPRVDDFQVGDDPWRPPALTVRRDRGRPAGADRLRATNREQWSICPATWQ